jgi:transposase
MTSGAKPEGRFGKQDFVYMGATHFLMKTLPKVASEMGWHSAYSPTSARAINIVGTGALLAAIRT